jgi:phage terminase small subunit
MLIIGIYEKHLWIRCFFVWKEGENVLTPKQEKFVQGIIEGKSQADAYRAAYSTKNMTDKTIREEASRLMSDPNVSAMVKELRNQVKASTIMSAQERMEWLTELIKNTNEGTTDRLRAIDIINKMTGEYVTKIDADVKNDITINVELSDEE